MSFPNHVNTSYTHSQSFEHCRTTVVKVIQKCILSVERVIIGHRVVTWGEMCCSCVMEDLCCFFIDLDLFSYQNYPKSFTSVMLAKLHSKEHEKPHVDSVRKMKYNDKH